MGGRKLQFSLRFLLIVMLAAGIGSFALREYLLGRRPVSWREFSQRRFDEYLHRGSPVLVFYSTPWSIESGYVESHLFGSPAVRRTIYANRVLPLRISASPDNFHTLADREAMESLCGRRNPPPGMFVICGHRDSPNCQLFDVGSTPDEVVIGINKVVLAVDVKQIQE